MKVSIVIGSKTDLDLAKASAEVLDSFGVENSINVLSAHRMPEVLQEHIQTELSSGTKVFIGIICSCRCLKYSIYEYDTIFANSSNTGSICSTNSH